MEQAQRPAVVWVVNRDHWPRALIVAELGERGFEARGYEDLGDAMVDLYRLFRDTPAALVLDSRDQPSDVPTLRALLAAGVPVLLVRSALESTEPQIEELPWAMVLRRPVSVGKICDSVEHIIGAHKRTAVRP